MVRSGSAIDAATLLVSARNNVDLATTVGAATVGSFSIQSTQQTRAGIDGGASVVVGQGAIDAVNEPASLLVEAIRYE